MDTHMHSHARKHTVMNNMNVQSSSFSLQLSLHPSPLFLSHIHITQRIGHDLMELCFRDRERGRQKNVPPTLFRMDQPTPLALRGPFIALRLSLFLSVLYIISVLSLFFHMLGQLWTEIRLRVVQPLPLCWQTCVGRLAASFFFLSFHYGKLCSWVFPLPDTVCLAAALWDWATGTRPLLPWLGNPV